MSLFVGFRNKVRGADAQIVYTSFDLDALSEELEDPFGVSANALPFHAISRTIEINLLDILGEKPLPEPIQAHHRRLE
ncbi:bestrophin family ion channel [Aliiglaciecola sp. SL4]|uniref:bestrophin family ion channel n=1 Tax=Aliiglaciecola sp. SL4 TaxID=3239806 RepID=UPI00355C250B